jgi:hypothetical protein
VASRDDLTAGVGPLWRKIALWRPSAVIFIYKRAAETAAGRRLTERWGYLEGVALAGRPCVLMPPPYARRWEVDEGVDFLRNLASLAGSPPKRSGDRLAMDRRVTDA